MSELDLYAKYLDLGVKLGRSGEDLTTWVEDKVRQDIERSDRQIEIERKREEMEMQKQREEKEMEMQRQREEMEMQKQREEMAFRREEKEREKQLELRRMELEAETKKLEIGSRASVDVSGPKQSYGAQRPKIPPLHDPSQVDLYLERFERHAAAFGWPESEWASCLSNLLKDEALSIFLSLSPAEGSDYQAVKRVLLQRWVELSGVSTLEGLSYLVCSEIALQACDEDFVAYIKDRSPSDMVALKSVASAYMDARPNKSFRKKDSVSFVAKSEPYHSTENFIVRSDASDFAVGAVLLQDRDGTLMPCRYASRKLLPRECKYSAIEREALALVFAVTQFQRYLIFKHFVLQTDHKPLAYLRTGSPKNARLMRWALALQEFSFHVVHIPGSENVHADVLSRLC
ncbi:retrovirus-related pol polyprotein from transposon 17.6 [Plakobranchus ocellatus]|uniref:Retrovirus-related pol polyprotein from transposon 17.6 n=1 Tax=Plakobranchus ocellatus TaxID=259542 RepID=A0AAV4CI79_9GAST|nr:retrovirus-related pol polyprotein from transposon 17.6 [Plakobranchus ocellatus]